MNRISCGNDADTLRPEARSIRSLTWSLYCLPLSSVAWGAYDLGFYQLCPCVHSSWEAVTKTNERSRRKKSADLWSCWNTAWPEVKAAAPSGLSHAIPSPSLITSPSPSSSSIFPSLQPFPYLLSLPFLPLLLFRFLLSHNPWTAPDSSPSLEY